MSVTLEDVTIPAPPPSPADWNERGVVSLPRLIPADLIRDYQNEWLAEHGYPGSSAALPSPGHTAKSLHARRPHGWADCTPYMRHPALRRLLTFGPLADWLEALIGEPAGLHLNLTGWVSTERDWHQDSYLNEPEVGDHYAAIWIALGSIHPDSGPFQYVPGSHRWPQVTRDLIGHHVDLGDPAWPKHSEEILSPLFEAEIVRRKAEVVSHLPTKGDVLIWHGRLLHRGSKPRVAGAYRPALIAHYSGIGHRPAMGTAVQDDPEGGWYFPLDTSGPVR